MVVNVYIAGPFSAKTEKEELANMERAKKLGAEIFGLGFNVFIPHVHTYDWNMYHKMPYEDYMRLDFSVIRRWADVLYYMGSSPGADMERILAGKYKIPVVESVKELEELRHGMLSYDRRGIDDALKRIEEEEAKKQKLSWLDKILRRMRENG